MSVCLFELSVDEVMPSLGNKALNFNGITLNGNTPTLKMLRKKGTECVCCGKQGTHFRVMMDENSREPWRHISLLLYTDDGSFLTRDHIIPKSNGGPNAMWNMQTMCNTCNLAKANTPPSIEQKIEVLLAMRKNGSKMTSKQRKWLKAAHDEIS